MYPQLRFPDWAWSNQLCNPSAVRSINIIMLDTLPRSAPLSRCPTANFALLALKFIPRHILAQGEQGGRPDSNGWPWWMRGCVPQTRVLVCACVRHAKVTPCWTFCIVPPPIYTSFCFHVMPFTVCSRVVRVGLGANRAREACEGHPERKRHAEQLAVLRVAGGLGGNRQGGDERCGALPAQHTTIRNSMLTTKS